MRTIVSFAFIMTALILTGCSVNKDSQLFDGEWLYRKGFETSWLGTEDSKGWRETEELSIDDYARTDTITLRKPLPRSVIEGMNRGDDLSLYMKDLTAEKVYIYVNAELIGSAEDHSTPWIGLKKNLLLPLRREKIAVEPVPILYLVITSYGNKWDRTFNFPSIASTDRIYRQYYTRVIGSAAIAVIFLISGIYHLLLGLRRPRDSYNLYFGFFAFSLALFEITNFPGMELLWHSHLILRAALDRISLKLTTASLVMFFSSLFGYKYGKAARLIAFFSLLLILQDLLIFFGFWQLFVLRTWYPAVAAALIYIGIILFGEARKKDYKAIVLSCGIGGVITGIIHDVLYTERLVSGPLLSPALLLLLFGGMTLVLINDFISSRNRVDEMNRNLENLVKDRSEALLAANSKIARLSRRKLFLGSYDLTFREKEISNLILDGKSTSAIADDLCISVRTVEKHIQHIYEKLSVHSRADILALYNDF